MSTSTFMLIALLRTVNEGGAVQVPYENEAACLQGGAQLEAQFEALTTGSGSHPTVMWTCLPGGS